MEINGAGVNGIEYGVLLIRMLNIIRVIDNNYTLPRKIQTSMNYMYIWEG